MPALPKVPVTTAVVDIGSRDHALAVARVLSGTSKREDVSRFMAVVRRFFRENPDEKKAFVKWYQDVPSVDDEEERPKKKKAKKHHKEESEEEED